LNTSANERFGLRLIEVRLAIAALLVIDVRALQRERLESVE